MNQKQNIKLYIKKSGDNYKVINNNSSFLRKQANDNYLNKTTVYKKANTGQLNNKSSQQKSIDINKGNARFRSWISCPCIYCNVIDEDKIIMAAHFALGQAKKEVTTKRAKIAKKY